MFFSLKFWPYVHFVSKVIYNQEREIMARLQYIYLRDIYQTQNIIDTPHFTGFFKVERYQ